MIEYDLTPQTVVSAGLSYQATRTDHVTWAGLPPYDSNGDLIDWPRGFNFGADWTYLNADRTEAFTDLEHNFDNGWVARLSASWARYEQDIELNWLSGIPDAETGLGLSSWAGKYRYRSSIASLGGTLNGEFEAFGNSHQFVLGAVGSRAKGKNRGYQLDDSPLGTVGSIFDYDGDIAQPTFLSTVNFSNDGEVTQFGIYGTAQLHATHRISLLGGARVNWWDGSSDSGVLFEYSYIGIVTPYIGFTYDVNDDCTLYGSVTNIFKPQLYQDADDNYLDPAKGWNYELGVKAGLFNDAVYASAAVFQTNQKDLENYLYYDPAKSRAVYELIDGATTRGFERELAGALTDRWNMSFGYIGRRR